MYKNILLPIDISSDDLTSDASQEKAIDTAINMAKEYGASIHAITVVPNFGMSIVNTYFPKDHAEQMMKDAKEKLGELLSKHIDDQSNVQKVVAYGTIYSEIVDYANEHNIDLIVMASHRPELKDYLLGPNAARVTRHAKCSTMIIRP